MDRASWRPVHSAQVRTPLHLGRAGLPPVWSEVQRVRDPPQAVGRTRIWAVSLGLESLHGLPPSSHHTAAVATAVTTQKRRVTWVSGQPLSSKWCWMGLIRKTRLPRVLNDTT
ncbi:hypothetical protein SAMN00790413_01157 [Deinococcus hopiensis KR-140]|uniref:Uncharacterized protein n=1 Tax=Deinococcus hopiensis KR-140 TaxID=695939 RepID=A0A1W1VEW7_9DEIO|nr:hypothetical protein SAMN00790413_01157 [Deinococcus hopiensis KR-140]